MSDRLESYDAMLSQYGLCAESYFRCSDEYARTYGSVFKMAFADFTDMKIHLVSALNDMAERRYEMAFHKLEIVSILAREDFDRAAALYFKGRLYELQENERAMTAAYDGLKAYGISFGILPDVLPYAYTVSRFRQAGNEEKALFYEEKARPFQEHE